MPLAWRMFKLIPEEHIRRSGLVNNTVVMFLLLAVSRRAFLLLWLGRREQYLNTLTPVRVYGPPQLILGVLLLGLYYWLERWETGDPVTDFNIGQASVLMYLAVSVWEIVLSFRIRRTLMVWLDALREPGIRISGVFTLVFGLLYINWVINKLHRNRLIPEMGLSELSMGSDSKPRGIGDSRR